MVTYLDCYVTSCVYNSNRCCGKGDILIEGKEARNNRETRCGSFVERKSDDFKNSSANLTKEIDVKCEATNCRFNDNKECNAEHIGISGTNACDCGDTECASFDCGC